MAGKTPFAEKLRIQSAWSCRQPSTCGSAALFGFDRFPKFIGVHSDEPAHRSANERDVPLPQSEKNGLTSWKTDPRKASAKKADDRVAARNRIRSPDRVVGP